MSAIEDNTDSEDSPTLRRWPHILRLGLFAAVLLTLFYLVAVARVVDVGQVRDAVAATGPVAPLAYLGASAVLAAIFVPGPLLAAGSGFVFGPVLGTFVTLGSTVTTATIGALIGRRAGRDSARALLGADWAGRIDAQIQRRGMWAVVGQRFVPGISDALASYAFGAFGMPLWQMALGACDHRGIRRASGVSQLARPQPIMGPCLIATRSVASWNRVAPTRSPASTETAAARPARRTSACTSSVPS